MGLVVKVVFLGCHPRNCDLGVGGVVLTILRVSALLVWEVSIVVLPSGVMSIDTSSTQAGFQLISNCIERIVAINTTICKSVDAETRLFPTYPVHSRTTKPTSLPADPAGRSHRYMSCRPI